MDLEAFFLTFVWQRPTHVQTGVLIEEFFGHWNVEPDHNELASVGFLARFAANADGQPVPTRRHANRAIDYFVMAGLNSQDTCPPCIDFQCVSDHKIVWMWASLPATSVSGKIFKPAKKYEKPLDITTSVWRNILAEEWLRVDLQLTSEARWESFHKQAEDAMTRAFARCGHMGPRSSTFRAKGSKPSFLAQGAPVPHKSQAGSFKQRLMSNFFRSTS